MEIISTTKPVEDLNLPMALLTSCGLISIKRNVAPFICTEQSLFSKGFGLSGISHLKV